MLLNDIVWKHVEKTMNDPSTVVSDTSGTARNMYLGNWKQEDAINPASFWRKILVVKGSIREKYTQD